MSNPLIEFYLKWNTNDITPVERGEMTQEDHWVMIQEVINNATEDERKEFNKWSETGFDWDEHNRLMAENGEEDDSN